MTQDESTPTPEATAGGTPNYTVISTRQTRKKRGFETARDMVWSMLAVLACVLVILAVTYRSNPDPIRVVDYRAVLAEARAANDSWSVLIPAKDIAGWKSTSARTEVQPEQKVAVFVGWVTASNTFASLQQTNLVGDRLQEWRDDATTSGVSIGDWSDAQGRTWQRMEADEQQSLVLSAAGATYVVSGTADWADLEALASQLR